MKLFDSGNALAKEIGVSSAKLQETFSKYNRSADDAKRSKGQDEFGKEHYNFFSLPWKSNDQFYVAVIGPTVHYTMGGIAADENAQCLEERSKKPIPGMFVLFVCLFCLFIFSML